MEYCLIKSKKKINSEDWNFLASLLLLLSFLTDLNVGQFTFSFVTMESRSFFADIGDAREQIRAAGGPVICMQRFVRTTSW